MKMVLYNVMKRICHNLLWEMTFIQINVFSVPGHERHNSKGKPQTMGDPVFLPYIDMGK